MRGEQLRMVVAGGSTCSRGARRLLKRLAVLARPDGSFHHAISDRELEAWLDASRSTVKRFRRELVEAGLLQVLRTGSGRLRSVYRLDSPWLAEKQEPDLELAMAAGADGSSASTLDPQGVRFGPPGGPKRACSIGPTAYLGSPRANNPPSPPFAAREREAPAGGGGIRGRPPDGRPSSATGRPSFAAETAQPTPPPRASIPDAALARLVEAVLELRPDWRRSSVLRALAACERPLELAGPALLRLAADRTTVAPGRLAGDGPWWRAQLASVPARSGCAAHPWSGLRSGAECAECWAQRAGP